MDWQSYYAKTNSVDLQALRPEEWQLILAERILEFDANSVLEAGSGYGMTSVLLGAGVEKRVLLDLEPVALATAARLFAEKGESGEFVVGDLLSMGFKEGAFDLVFNAGVLEHFDFSMRCQALCEMYRVVRPGGRVLVAVPNHFSHPYRYSYHYRKKRGRWPYPDELPIYDLREEIQAAGLQLTQQRETVAKETAYFFLKRHQRWLFKLAARLYPFEGYLTVLTLTRAR